MNPDEPASETTATATISGASHLQMLRVGVCLHAATIVLTAVLGLLCFHVKPLSSRSDWMAIVAFLLAGMSVLMCPLLLVAAYEMSFVSLENRRLAIGIEIAMTVLFVCTLVASFTY